MLNWSVCGLISRVPDQNGVSQAWHIVEIHYSGWKPSIWFWNNLVWRSWCNFVFEKLALLRNFWLCQKTSEFEYSWWFLIQMSNIQIYVMSDVCRIGWQAGPPSCVAKTLDMAWHTNFSTKFFHTCHAYRHHKAKSLGLIFSHSFQLIKMKFDMELKQLKLNILILLLNHIWWKQGNNCCFTLCWETLTPRHLWIDFVKTWFHDWSY